MHELEGLREQILSMSESDSKSLLFQAMITVDTIETDKMQSADGIERLVKIKKLISDVSARKDPTKGIYTRYHILFGDSAGGALKHLFSTEGIRDERVLAISDYFAEGPIENLHETKGFVKRFRWIKENVIRDEYEDFLRRYFQMMEEIDSIPEEVPITIWTSNNSHEQIGVRFIIYLLKGRKNEVKLINTNHLFHEFLAKPGSHYFLTSASISPDHFNLMYNKSQDIVPLMASEKEKFLNEWIELSREDTALRIWKNDQIVSVDETYFDSLIFEKARVLTDKRGDEYMKSGRLIGEVLGNIENQFISDLFLEYRLRKLIDKGHFDVVGDLAAMRYYSVKLK
ncbi:DUF1835 domain-containing protein [Bacillus sp. 2205SS5-2]|uniref:DUF1835 domain-containing protein n=1 Tax=Bacillus sp. 2205SS5-2 TaxID=3109031 RepID=UPI003005F5F7